MPYNHEKINQLTGGWYVVMHDGAVFTEAETSWTTLANKKNIKIMGLKWRHKYHEIEGKEAYIPPGETHFRELGLHGSELRVTPQELYERFIGYYDTDGKVYYRVNVKSGELRVEKIPYQD